MVAEDGKLLDFLSARRKRSNPDPIIAHLILVSFHHKVISLTRDEVQSVGRHRLERCAVTRDDVKSVVFDLKLEWAHVGRCVDKAEAITFLVLNVVDR